MKITFFSTKLKQVTQPNQPFFFLIHNFGHLSCQLHQPGIYIDGSVEKSINMPTSPVDECFHKMCMSY